jgi:hypothetical protein
MSLPAANGVELFYDFVERPEDAAETAAERPPVAFGVLAYCLAAATLFLTQTLTGGGVFGVSPFGLGMFCLWNLASGILVASLVHVFADGMGGRGRVIPLFVMLGYSELGWALSLPGTLIVLALFPESVVLPFVPAALTGVLVFALKVRSIRLNYGFSRLQAALSLGAPYATLAAAVLLGFGGFLWMLVAAATKAAA